MLVACHPVNVESRAGAAAPMRLRVPNLTCRSWVDPTHLDLSSSATAWQEVAMIIALSLSFLAPIPVGHRVQVISTQWWISPLFGGAGRWEPISLPIIADLDTGIVYCHSSFADALILTPLSFKPDAGYQITNVVEGRVTSCLVSTYSGNVPPSVIIRCDLTVEQTPQGY